MQVTKHKNCFDKKDLGMELNNETSLILAVDNDPDNLLLINLVLSSFHYNVVMTANTQNALSMAKSYQPDLILLGINFPGVKESELCYQLKQEKQLLRECPQAQRSSLGRDSALILRPRWV